MEQQERHGELIHGHCGQYKNSSYGSLKEKDAEKLILKCNEMGTSDQCNQALVLGDEKQKEWMWCARFAKQDDRLESAGYCHGVYRECNLMNLKSVDKFIYFAFFTPGDCNKILETSNSFDPEAWKVTDISNKTANNIDNFENARWEKAIEENKYNIAQNIKAVNSNPPIPINFLQDLVLYCVAKQLAGAKNFLCVIVPSETRNYQLYCENVMYQLLSSIPVGLRYGWSFSTNTTKKEDYGIIFIAEKNWREEEDISTVAVRLKQVEKRKLPESYLSDTLKKLLKACIENHKLIETCYHEFEEGKTLDQLGAEAYEDFYRLHIQETDTSTTDSLEQKTETLALPLQKESQTVPDQEYLAQEKWEDHHEKQREADGQEYNSFEQYFIWCKDNPDNQLGRDQLRDTLIKRFKETPCIFSEFMSAISYVERVPSELLLFSEENDFSKLRNFYKKEFERFVKNGKMGFFIDPSSQLSRLYDELLVYERLTQNANHEVLITVAYVKHGWRKYYSSSAYDTIRVTLKEFLDGISVLIKKRHQLPLDDYDNKIYEEMFSRDNNQADRKPYIRNEIGRILEESGLLHKKKERNLLKKQKITSKRFNRVSKVLITAVLVLVVAVTVFAVPRLMPRKIENIPLSVADEKIIETLAFDASTEKTASRSITSETEEATEEQRESTFSEDDKMPGNDITVEDIQEASDLWLKQNPPDYVKAYDIFSRAAQTDLAKLICGDGIDDIDTPMTQSIREYFALKAFRDFSDKNLEKKIKLDNADYFIVENELPSEEKSDLSEKNFDVADMVLKLRYIEEGKNEKIETLFYYMEAFSMTSDYESTGFYEKSGTSFENEEVQKNMKKVGTTRTVHINDALDKIFE